MHNSYKLAPIEASGRQRTCVNLDERTDVFVLGPED